VHKIEMRQVFLPVFQFPPRHHHSTTAPYSFIHLPPTLYHVFLPVILFPPSPSFHHCSILIHSSTTYTVSRFSPSTSVFPRHHNSTTAPYSFIHLPPTLYHVFLPVIQFSPVTIIPPMLHTHSFIYHRHCITFFLKYCSFPCHYHVISAPYSFVYRQRYINLATESVVK
jgi:hypothetical protein